MSELRSVTNVSYFKFSLFVSLLVDTRDAQKHRLNIGFSHRQWLLLIQMFNKVMEIFLMLFCSVTDYQLHLPPSSFSGEDRGEMSKEAPPGKEYELSVRLR